ncbi:hypothetical protein SAMN06295998_11160 [Primorskyibacter flagellatus]|uniref:Uncharacterized protein n=1 Tax=Primorskyibacter flagellatus TaxID=1387277 RepID=A0A1W2D7Q1_9RHOB|nr:hypothetical protein SAMN06295998_11160 [Primorskyibacter flagellatus]
MAMGMSASRRSGDFESVRLPRALHDFRITNLAAAATQYRMTRNSGEAKNFTRAFDKLSFTDEPVCSEIATYVDQVFGTEMRLIYGTTEIGVTIANRPGFLGRTIARLYAVFAARSRALCQRPRQPGLLSDDVLQVNRHHMTIPHHLSAFDEEITHLHWPRQ